MIKKSRFNTVKEYFDNIKAVTKANMKFVDRATMPLLSDDDDHWRDRVFITPAVDGEEWDEMNHGNTAYVAASDGYRLHVAIVPVQHVKGRVISYENDLLTPDLQSICRQPDPTKGEIVHLNAQYLRDAIHPDAEEVTIYIPHGAAAKTVAPTLEERQHSAIQVVSRRNTDAQIAWAAVMPMNYEGRGKNAPEIHVPVLMTADEVRERYEEQQQAAAVRQLATEGEEEEQGDEVGQGQPVFAAA